MLRQYRAQRHRYIETPRGWLPVGTIPVGTICRPHNCRSNVEVLAWLLTTTARHDRARERDTTMQKFLTIYLLESDEVIALTEQEYLANRAQDGLETWLEETCDDDWSDYVWQYAATREQAIAQHFSKLDEWEADPTKEVY